MSGVKDIEELIHMKWLIVHTSGSRQLKGIDKQIHQALHMVIVTKNPCAAMRTIFSLLDRFRYKDCM